MVLLCIPSPAENSCRKSFSSGPCTAPGARLGEQPAPHCTGEHLSRERKLGKRAAVPHFCLEGRRGTYFKHFKVTVTFFHRSREENNRQVEEGKEEGNESSHSKSSPSSQLCPSEQPGEVRRGQSLSCTKGAGSGSL